MSLSRHPGRAIYPTTWPSLTVLCQAFRPHSPPESGHTKENVMRGTRWMALIMVLGALAPSWLGAQNASKASPAPAPLGRTAFNTIYVELGGNGLWYSLNYERMMQSH